MSPQERIRSILGGFNEPYEGNVWAVQGTPVIKHSCLERLAASAKIAFDLPQVIRSERDEAVILVSGRLGERMEWSVGEALVGVNYRVSGKQAAYVWAMAEKRAKDRVILKLIELHGVAYSEEEADEFRDGQRRDEPAHDPKLVAVNGLSEMEARETIASATDPNIILRFMRLPEFVSLTKAMHGQERDELRAFAETKLRALGWTPRERAEA